MEQELNIAAILRDKPVGTKLYSPCCGECTKGNCCDSERPITLYLPNRVLYRLLGNGKEFESGEIMVYPSKEMRDWSKFAWKKGDVLICGVDSLCIFDKWANDDYTEFDAKYATPNYGDAVLKTKDWSKVSREATIKNHIDKIEDVRGGKLNLSTLEIEHKPQFKDGDIVVREENIAKSYAKCILIFKAARNTDNRVGCYAFYNDFNKSVNLGNTLYKGEFRLATEEEKQQLFDALTDINKFWNAKTKTLEDLPKKCEFNPKDWCLMRRGSIDAWHLCQYSDACDDGYYAVGGNFFKECIPYNEKTAHLLGTTDDYEK